MNAIWGLASRLRGGVLVAGVALAVSLLPSNTPAFASEFFDDMQRIIHPRLQVLRGQRIRVMIRDLVTGRLRVDSQSGDRQDTGILGLGSIISPAADQMATSTGWSAWVDGNITYLESTDTFALFNGYQNAAGAGLDYALSDSIIAGVSVNYEHADTKNRIGAFPPGREKTNRVGVGPYIGVAITNDLVFDASFNYWWADNKLSDNLSRADFNSHGYDITANLTAFLPLSDTVTLAPTAGIAYSYSRDESYQDNVGFVQPTQEITSGVFNFGAKLSYFHAIDDVRSIEPSVSVDGRWEFHLAGKPPLGFGMASNANDPQFDVTITTAMAIALSHNFSLALTSGVGGLLRKDYIEVSGGAQATIQF